MDIERRGRLPEFKFNKVGKFTAAVVLTTASIVGAPTAYQGFENAKASLCNPLDAQIIAADTREYDALKDFPTSIKPPGCGDAAGLADPKYRATLENTVNR